MAVRDRSMLRAAEPATIPSRGVAGKTEVAWVQALQRARGGDSVDPTRRELQQAGWKRFAQLGLPTTRQEAWRWFPVGHLAKHAFTPPPPPEAETDVGKRLADGQLESLLLHDLGGPRLVFVDGALSPGLSRPGPTELERATTQILLAPLMHANALEARAAFLGRMALDATNPFLALNDAFFDDGAWVQVRRGHEPSPPVHLVFVTTRADAPRVVHARVLVQVENGAEAEIVQEHVGLAEQPCLVNVVTEAHVGSGGTLRCVKLAHDSASTTHVATTAVRQERDSSFESHSFAWNAGHVRNDLDVRLAAEGAHCTLRGLIHLRDEQIADDHTVVRHLEPHTTSIEHYRAVLDGRSRGAFNGAVYVSPDAQKINSQQSSRNLLLSDEALMNTKPELQILADDVKCSHGATIGQLDREALFYLRSRGIDVAEAHRILTQAFGRAVVEHVPHEKLRRALMQELFGGVQDGD